MIRTFGKHLFTGAMAIGLSLTLYGCGGGSTKGTAGNPTEPLGQQSDISISGSTAGVTPFIASVQMTGQSIADLVSVNFTIAPMTNSVSKPVSVTWSTRVLADRGYLNGTTINLPVFGLYANYQNQVTFNLLFSDSSTQQLQSQISTDPYTDPTAIYQHPTIMQARAPGTSLGYDFMILKSLNGPVIIDTDAQLRWVVPMTPTLSVYYADGQFVAGSVSQPQITLIQMDGTSSLLKTDLTQPQLNEFNHNIDPSPGGYLAEFNGADDLGISEDDIVADLSPFPNTAPLQIFDMADILSSYMTSQGDDASAFVRPGTDWFHVNASTYDFSDQTVIVSGREDFLIKLNYATREIVWILGDPTKYWYTFPSLRAKALTLNAGGDYPIGQHGVSVTSEGYVMVMNDGYGSLNQPAGAPTGLTRTFSEVSAYSINAANMTAQNVWNFNYGQSIYSPICGSSYQTGSSYLVDFSTAGDYTLDRLVGLDSNKNVVFDFQYNSPTYCGASWNAISIPMENLQID